jgi:hypothetical protein
MRQTSYRGFRYIDDVLSLNNSRFGDFVDRIYLIELEIKDTDRSASYLDLHLEVDCEGQLRTKLYDKGDDFYLPIMECPSMCSNIPAATAYISVDTISPSFWLLSGFP